MRFEAFGFRVVLREKPYEVRGGSWYRGRSDAHCTGRFDSYYDPGSHGGDWGFRVVVNDD